MNQRETVASGRTREKGRFEFLIACASLINICDLAIMAEEAEIGIPQISWGIYPGIASASTQTRILRKHSAWPILTGSRISTATAVEVGMVNMTVRGEKLLDEAKALAGLTAALNRI